MTTQSDLMLHAAQPPQKRALLTSKEMLAAPKSRHARLYLTVATVLALTAVAASTQASTPVYPSDVRDQQNSDAEASSEEVLEDEEVETTDANSAEHYLQVNGALDGSDAAAAYGEGALALGASAFADGDNATAIGHGAMALDADTTAIGPFSLAAGQGASAIGFGTTALGEYSSALGYGSSATGYTALAFGYQVVASGDGAIAIGNQAYLTVSPWSAEGAWFNTRAEGALSTALGPGASSLGAVSVAVGPGAEATADLSMALGYRAQATEFKSLAVGVFSEAYGYNALAIGTQASARATDTVALGVAAIANADQATALGAGTYANGSQSTAIGYFARAWAQQSTAIGNAAFADGFMSNAIGYQSQTWGEGSIALGTLAQTGGDRPPGTLPPTCEEQGDCDVGTADVEKPAHAIAIGTESQAFGTGSIALGHRSLTLSDNSVALGAGSLADRDNTISVGAAANWYRKDGTLVEAFQRQITNVAHGTEDYDAVNMAQLKMLASALGGGANVQFGVLNPPNYVIQGDNYFDVGSAFAAVDGKLSDLQNAIDNRPPGPPGPPGNDGPEGPPGPPGPPGEGNTDGIAYDGPDKDSITLGGANGTQIRNVADGVAASDGVNKGQMDAGDAASVKTANDYTDTVATRTLSSANAYTDRQIQALNDDFMAFTKDIEQRLSNQGKRMDRLGAMNSAMMNMSINAAGSRSPRGRIAVGAGWQNGQSALSIGYAKSIGERASFSVGGAFTSEDSSAGVGFGIDL